MYSSSHISASNQKMKSDVERRTRGLNFGRLYFQNKEYQTAEKYVKDYLSVKPSSSEAYKLLAQINEAMGNSDNALQYYRKSLELKKLNSDSYSFVTPNNQSSPLNNISPHNNERVTPERPSDKKETPVRNNYERSYDQTLLTMILQNQQNLMESHKTILDVLNQNNGRMANIEQKVNHLQNSINGITDNQNVLKDTLLDYITHENDAFEDYVSDKENDIIEGSGMPESNMGLKWHSSAIQLNPQSTQADDKRPLSEMFKPPADSWKCDICLVNNDHSLCECAACGSANPNDTQFDKLENSQNARFQQSLSNSELQNTQFRQSLNNSGFGSQNTPFQQSLSNSGFNFDNFNTTSSSVFASNTFKFGNFSANINTPFEGLQLKTTPKTGAKNEENVAFQFGAARDFNFQFPTLEQQNNTQTAIKSPQSVAINTSVSEHEESFTEPSNADNIYFQPVIPLPPKIEVKTGEEEEKVLYSCRAKLFRFCNNEWKERGTGDVKILQSPQTSKVRLVMRRDTVLKVCLNHYITTDLSLELKGDSKSIQWSAMDYSEEPPTAEVFAMRFKNSDVANGFLDAFKSAQSLLNSECCDSQTDASVEQIDSDIAVVYVKKPQSEQKLQKALSLKLPINFYSYEDLPPCPGCRGCVDDIPIIPQTNQSESKRDANIANDETNSLFSSAVAEFGKANKINWEFANKSNTNKSPLFSVTPSPIFANRSHEEGDDESVVQNADIYFKPVIPLPELVEVKTGEEDEEPIFSQRAKLYRFDATTKEWKERGIGDFKILKHKSQSRYRLLLRREQILKIACNHYISPAMKLTPMSTSETAICWFAVDFSEGKATEEQFALKFKSKELLQEFVNTFEKCKIEIINESEGKDRSYDGDADTED